MMIAETVFPIRFPLHLRRWAVKKTAGRTRSVVILDGYFLQASPAYQCQRTESKNIGRGIREDPSKYPNLTIRVSGYAVNVQSSCPKNSKKKSSSAHSMRQCNMTKGILFIHFQSYGYFRWSGNVRWLLVFMQGCPLRCGYCHRP